MIRDYHRWMGGVDIHDQLRLQRYSLQQQTKCKTYYKAILLGLVDIALRQPQNDGSNPIPRSLPDAHVSRENPDFQANQRAAQAQTTPVKDEGSVGEGQCSDDNDDAANEEEGGVDDGGNDAGELTGADE
ncbi:uncharacterized protein PITG_20959 [Phytophthora infestans T30-4]|uniref:PiggyBac transposable element-derived protein domain-containing protein n=1 Tax=Phytophthora infestans (strain T30-4) TaxID=403677 RepID=D0P2W2_PHYIT|nr:uncharacterized protein PITG_20959 [Phytophthora infestans T30-4]EEY57101.1 hypothetical protein PITG_20959 [Phytophthora infestans T30-4]|eukprot:XP_002895359.1 hypothetical protein PITG_20959 [Phytophthora infestans T30-4]